MVASSETIASQHCCPFASNEPTIYIYVCIFAVLFLLWFRLALLLFADRFFLGKSNSFRFIYSFIGSFIFVRFVFDSVLHSNRLVLFFYYYFFFHSISPCHFFVTSFGKLPCLRVITSHCSCNIYRKIVLQINDEKYRFLWQNIQNRNISSVSMVRMTMKNFLTNRKKNWTCFYWIKHNDGIEIFLKYPKL